MKYTPPEIGSEAFTCPFCSVYSHVTWVWLSGDSSKAIYVEGKCSKCKERSLWRTTETKTDECNRVIPSAGDMLYPNIGLAPPPHEEMPEEIKADYLEAARIAQHSPRGSAALLRLCLQKLCKHLKEPGENIYNDIRSLADKGTIPTSTVQVADTIRLAGNAAVHPGLMVDDDIDHIANKMFLLLNILIDKSIAEPRLMRELYEMTPEGARKAAEEKDRNNREKKK
ncbi:DUF4145 domain-containing protein [Pseudomonas putida]|uniref:DUF4145 domain-containing protein n=1 Tax=Pseudomonas putida TaxID=303 RepID=UPI00235D5EEA|nr:DUF4145 domain-containing protein [Pseudomonas putida]GLO24370.1 hypothetical protein PPUJ21368_21980 [Pseudomonas putida]HDS0969240.1 DUF4145 domain-containing protein [Pseudomonas putida]